MSSTSAKKATTTTGPANPRRPSANPSTSSSSITPAPSSRSPTRMSATSGTTTPGAQSLNRTRSSRTGTPVSARAAARRPAASNEADDEVRAEMQAKYDELQEQLRLADERSTQVQRQAAVLQIKLDEALKEQGLLEESVHEQVEKVNDLENEKKESVRARREMEQIYESERSAAMKEREEAQTRQEDMQASMQRLKEALNSREMRAGLDDERRPSLSRNSSFRNSANPSPNPEMTSPFAPPATLQRSDSRSSSKLVMQKDKMIESLRLELAEAHIKLVELENMGGGRLQKLEAGMYEVKMQNARLMEENESFQLLLSEKTLNGHFGQSEMLRPRSNNGSRPPSRHPQGNSLADELEGHDEAETSEDSRRLQAEVSSLKDQNKALTLYINNIISRLLQHDQFEQILDKTPDIFSSGGAASTAPPSKPQEKALPAPPPSETDDEPPAGFLQRARSVMGAKRPRPQSQIFPSTTPYTDLSSDQPGPRPTEDPSTAPQVPLGRRAVSGGQSAHRRSNSEWAGAANLVNQMYRPTPSATPSTLGPASPGLASPTSTRTYFFGAAPGPGSRVPSGNTVPTIASNSDTTKPPQRDSKVPAEPSAATTAIPDDQTPLSSASNPSSPPRSLNSSGESTAGGRGSGGAIMMGSKIRPLRLVREAEESRGGGGGASAGGAGNRGSWFGWMNKGLAGEAGKGGGSGQ